MILIDKKNVHRLHKIAEKHFYGTIEVMQEEIQKPKKSLAYRISQWNRARKFRLFLSIISPKKIESILDVGVNNEEYSESDNYLEKHYPFPESLTVAALGDLSLFQERYPNIRAVSADGRSLPFPDNAFDIAYSNAVIEHVGNSDDQQAFFHELVRVSRRGYLTTPNRYFPIEVHTRIPLLHILLPKKHFDAFLSSIGKSWATGEYMNLLSKSDLASIARSIPLTSYRIIPNRFCGIPLTFTLVWKK